MEKPTRPLRPAFIWCLAATFLVSLAAMLFLPEPRVAKKARVKITRVWERNVAAFLQQHLVESGELTNLDNRLVAQGVFGTNSVTDRLNSKGEILDYWKTPFEIKILAPTNFIIRSAGPNRKFGDRDDIIFNSLTNDFVEP